MLNVHSSSHQNMASDSGEDPDLESLRSAVLASLKTKPGGTASQGQSDENATKSDEEESEEEEEKLNEHPEDEEDLHALRLAALKSKRDDSVPKAAPTTFERKGNLISIQIVDPEEERRKKEEEMKAKAQANAAIDPDNKAAKPARFRRFDSSDSENDEEEEDDQKDSDQSEDEKSVNSSSSSSSSESDGSGSSKSSDSSSSESDKESKSSSSSESESEDDERTKEKEKQEESGELDARSKQDGHMEGKVKGTSEKEGKERHQSGEGKRKDEKSVKGSRSVKDRLGVRLPEGQSRTGSDKNVRSSERERDGRSRDERRDRSERKEEGRKTDRLIGNSNDRHRVKGHSGDLRDRLRQDKGRRDFQEKEHRRKDVEHSSRRRNENRRSSKHLPNEVNRRIRERPRIDRRIDTLRNSRTDNRHGGAEKNNNYTDRKTLGKDPNLRNSNGSKSKNVVDVSQKSTVQISKKASDSESLSDIPLESEEEKGNSDSENVRFRKGRHEAKSEKNEHDDQSNSQSRIVMSLQLLTESELKKADDKISKDFKKRRNKDGFGLDNSSKNISRDGGRIDLRTVNRRSRNSERRGQSSPDRTSWPRGRGDFGRRKPRPSDFVSESESENEEKTGSSLRSQVSGTGDAHKKDRNFTKTDSANENSKKDDKKRDSKTERDERRRRERRERREKRIKRRLVEEKPDNHASDEENGEEAVKQLSIRDRLGDRPISGLRSSIKSRLGPKVSSPTPETKDAEVPDHPKAKVRKIEVSYKDSDSNFDSRLGDLGSIEGTLEQEEKLVTKPDDLRHKMRRKLHKTEEDKNPEEVVGVKRKVMKNNVWAEVLQERSARERKEGSASPHRGGSRGREQSEERKENKKEVKRKDDEMLDAKIKRIKEMNAAILEKQKQIQKEKELFDS